MKCPFCSADNTRVLESRTTNESDIRRRRECGECNKRFTTYERLESSPVMIVKNSGSRDVFSREKVFNSIVRACSKSQLSGSLVEDMVNEVELVVTKLNRKEIPSSVVGNVIMEILKSNDPMSYIRYASVFKKFTSVAEFLEEIKELEDELLGIEYEEAGTAATAKA